MYIDYFEKDLRKNAEQLTTKKLRSLQLFKANLLEGISYYQQLIPQLKNEAESYLNKMRAELAQLEEAVQQIALPVPAMA